MTEDDVRLAVLQDEFYACLNDSNYLRDVIEWAFRDHTPEMFTEEFKNRGLKEDT